MMRIAPGVRVRLVAGATDMRRGFDGLCALVQGALKADPLSGQILVFRGRRGDRIKVLWFDTHGLCLFYKRIERGRFICVALPQRDCYPPASLPHLGCYRRTRV